MPMSRNALAFRTSRCADGHNEGGTLCQCCASVTTLFAFQKASLPRGLKPRKDETMREKRTPIQTGSSSHLSFEELAALSNDAYLVHRFADENGWESILRCFLVEHDHGW